MRLVVLILLLSSTRMYCQWEAIFSFPQMPSSNTALDLTYNGDGRLFLLKSMEVLVSDNFGLSWDTSYATFDQGDYRQLYFHHPDTGYLVKGVGPGLFLRTYDAGDTWETVVPVSGVYSEEATSVFVLDKDHLYFSIWDGASGKIVWTNDGGLTTQLAYPEIWQPSGISGMACKDPDTCTAVSGFPYYIGFGGNDGLCPVYRTSSCCDIWEYTTYTPGGAQKLIYKNWNLMYTYTPLFVFRSNDQFQTMDTIMTYGDINDEFNELHFVNDSVGYLSIRRYSFSGDEVPTRVLRTTNFGETWEETTFDWSLLNPDTLFKGSINAIECLSETDCFLMAGRTLFRTTNGGLASTYDIASLSLTLHPNPATDQLFLDGLASYPDAVWNTYSISGQAIPLDLRKGQADISHLPPGIYLTTVQTGQGIWREKWVKL